MNQINVHAHVSGDMCSTMIYTFCGFCVNARFLHIIAQICASCAAIPFLCPNVSIIVYARTPTYTVLQIALRQPFEFVL